MRTTTVIVSLFAALWLGGAARAESVAGASQPSPRPMLTPGLVGDLVAANHILVDQGVIDVRGHVSVRDPSNANLFWISRAVAPGMMEASDLQAFDLDGRQIAGAPGEAFTERFIHARIYKARPDVNAIVHAHTRSLVTISVSGVALRPVTIAALFAGGGVPVNVNGRAGAGIFDSVAGDALARTLGSAGAVLMQGHGAVIVGASIPSAVGRSVGLDIDAQSLINLLSMSVKPIYLEPSADVVARPGDYAREWAWWKKKIGAP